MVRIICAAVFLLALVGGAYAQESGLPGTQWEGKVVKGDVRDNVYFVHKGFRYHVPDWKYVTPFGLSSATMLRVTQADIDALPEGPAINSIDEVKRYIEEPAHVVTPEVATRQNHEPVASITTTDGRTFTNVTARRVEGDTVLLFHSEGAAKVPLSVLSDETRKALGLRTRADEVALQAKGLVKSGTDWVTPEEKQRREDEKARREVDAKVQKVVDAQSRRNVTYKVSQALDDGSLCYMGSEGDGEQFYLYGATKKTVADEEVYKDNLYWAGNYTYTTTHGAERTVKSYTLDRAVAIQIVKTKFDLTTNDTGSPDATPGESSPPTKSAGLHARGLGTGFAITEDGYIITAYHVIKGANAIRVKTEKFRQGFLGVEIQQLTHELAKSHGADGTEGVLIAKVGVDVPNEDSRPATNLDGGKADLRNGDIITQVAGRAVKSLEQFQDAVASMSPGDKVSVEIVRDGNAQTVKVVLGGRTTELLAAEVVATDEDNDLALLKVNKKTECVAFASARAASLGQTVFTVGFPMPDVQGFSPKVTKGVISGLKGIKDDVRKYQIDASVQPGNSGGPLADESGNIVGVVVARLNDAAIIEQEGVVPQNVNYSVKLSYVLALIDANPEVAKKIHVAKDNAKVSFEEAVEKVRKATLIIVSY